jgi:hypothetical protein
MLASTHHNVLNSGGFMRFKLFRHVPPSNDSHHCRKTADSRSIANKYDKHGGQSW